MRDPICDVYNCALPATPRYDRVDRRMIFSAKRSTKRWTSGVPRGN